MKINEELRDPEAKKKFRELVKKYHPDMGGDSDTIKKINNAKDLGDNALVDLYNELLKIPKKSEEEEKVVSELKTEINRRRPAKPQKVKDILMNRKPSVNKKRRKKEKFSQDIRDILKKRK